ncbi:MAG: asparagine synthetase B family protein [Proteobacteria bacterium]|nr:asparagine synthetase B family protein [Pseudomonadota bacterium]
MLRAPFGDLGCFHCWTTEATYVASDLDLLLRATRIERRIDADAVARHLAWPEVRSGETCIENLKELRGGDRLTIAGDRSSEDTVWSPGIFAAQERQIGDALEGQHRLRDAVRLAVGGRAADHERVLLLLSGGFDSSLVAACLHKAGAAFDCLNLLACDRESDEQDYAIATAAAVDASLRVERLIPADVDVAISGAAHQPYPVHRAFTQAQDRHAHAAMTAMGATAVFDGGGGDNVFFGTRSVSMLADCLHAGGFDLRFREATLALAGLAQLSAPLLALRAIGRAWLRGAATRQPLQTPFLDRDIRRRIGASPDHPWFRPPKGILPGRAAHLALIVAAQSMTEALNPGAPFTLISPLASQPVVEAALRIPSWCWLGHGRDRAAARAAFERDLPDAIVRRRSKGTPAAFVAQVFETNRVVIRDMLLGGWLAEQRLINALAVERALAREGPPRDLGFGPLMSLVDAEAWARAQLRH